MLPKKVLEQVKTELLNWNSTNLSVMELSHRSQEYLSIHNKLLKDLRLLYNIPSEYQILLMHGGATLQYSAIPMNLLQVGDTAAYIITGQYSNEAFVEAKKYCNPIRLELNSEIPDDAQYIYYVDNEVNDGVQVHTVPESKGKILICDMTSSFGTKPIDIEKYGCIFASLQYHMGIPSLSCVIIKNDLIGRSQRKLPSMANYKIMRDYNSIYNTIPCFNVYITLLCVENIIFNGGLEKFQEELQKKSAKIWNFIIEHKEKYECSVTEQLRSTTSIIFQRNSNNNNVQQQKKLHFLITINTTNEEIELFLQGLEQQ